MIKSIRRLAFVLLVFVCIFSLSCGLNTGEAKNAGAKVENAYQVISGVQGVSLNTAPITIKLSNANLITGANTTSGLVNKTVSIEPAISGVSATVTGVYSANFTPSITVSFTGTPSEINNTDFIKITLPKEFFQNRISSLVVDSNNLSWNIVSPSDLYVGQKQTSNLTITNVNLNSSTVNKSTINDVTLTLDARNAIFNTIDDPDVSSWFSPAIKGLNYTVTSNVQGSSSITIKISGTPLENSVSSLVKVTIPRGTLKKINSDGTVGTDYNYDYDAAVRLSNRVALSVYGRVQDAVTVSGFMSKDASGEYSTVDSKELTISLSGTAFKMIEKGADVSSWFSPIVSGLSYNIKDMVMEGANSCTVVISGAPENAVNSEFDIVVPLDKTTISTSQYGSTPISVDTKGSSYNIRKNGTFIDVEVYDLATYGDVKLSVISPNKGLTKKANGDDLTFDVATNSIASIKQSPVVIAGGLSRHGYKLAGFNKRNLDGTVSIDTTNLDYAVSNTNEIKIADNGDITIVLKSSDTGEKTRLYAIWEVDAEAWGWTKNANGTYQKTYDISGYNAETGENAFFPATFNLKKSGISEADQVNYQDYPYYKEAKILAKGLKMPTANLDSSTTTNDYVDLDDVTMTSDFAIGEHPITGYMIDVLRTWNANGSKGYDIPDMAESVPSVEATASDNAVGYGASYINSRWGLINDPSNPITYVTVTQAMVLANAFTAYYNEMNETAHTANFVRLTPAYINAQSTEIKTLVDAKTLYEATTQPGAVMADPNSNGFRLPTEEEWALAARVVPESTYDPTLTGAHLKDVLTPMRNYMYPQITRSDMFSGADVITSKSTVANLYVYYNGNSGDSGGNANISTHGFLKSKKGNAQGGTVLDKRSNNIGVYGMSGNVWDWCDRVPASTDARRLRGGSFYNAASNTRVGYLIGYSPSYRLGFIGLRLARSV